MVKVKEQRHFLDNGEIDTESWLEYIASKQPHNDMRLLRNACILAQLAGQDQPTETGESCLQQGLAIAEILDDLDLDDETLAAAIIYESVLYGDLSLDDVEEQLGDSVAKLVRGLERMSAITYLRNEQPFSTGQIDNIRKMLLAMVDDVRIVLIKLAERLRMLRTASHLSERYRTHIARETMDIYAPLANRLGIGQLKWQLEDLAFRYLESEKYKEIASGLKGKRLERDRYVAMITEMLADEIQKRGVKNAKVYGRSKHIYSIYRKMQRKNLTLEQVYDATAMRVLVDDIEACYQVLSCVHELFKHIPEEFDDYIANPKPNGYRSLHTAVIGPEDRNFEVQIRTYDLHEEAELGVAAHWRYKEDSKKQDRHETKIAWLREVLAWQKETADRSDHALPEDYFEDRVYVFTPNGDVVDLPFGATPLDFAYHIHSEVGHRCRGAKINGTIVPLTHALVTGDTVEIFTSKIPHPSRDWLNPHQGYVKSSRAKAKIMHWFKLQDFDKHVEQGKEAMDRECRRLNIKQIDYDAIAPSFNFKKAQDIFASVGRGDLTPTQVINRLPKEEVDESKLPESLIIKPRAKVKVEADDIHINGVGHLLTTMAHCCNPLPGEDIVGYVTVGRGISVHRVDCSNILSLPADRKARLIQVGWGKDETKVYPMPLAITAYDRQGLLRDITLLLTNERVNVLNLVTNIDKKAHLAHIQLTVEVSDLSRLSRLLDRLSQLENVIEARRV